MKLSVGLIGNGPPNFHQGRKKPLDSNLIYNGSFDANTDGWSPVDGGITLESVAGGKVRNCLQITSSFKYAWQNVILNGSYTLTIYHKNESGQGYLSISSIAGGVDIIDSGALDDSDWVKYTYTFTYVGSAFINLFNWAGGTTTLFDEAYLIKNP
jgi:hypothetical protein